MNAIHQPLKGLHAVVTGSSRGIGLAIANKLFEWGASVTGTSTQQTTAQGTNGNKFKWIAADFANPDDVKQMASTLCSSNVDILINNAGINKIAPFSQIPLEDFDTILQVNLRTPFQLMQAVVPHMETKGWGRIINVASIFSVVSRAQRASYSASKFGLDGLTTAAAAELAAKGILINTVSPGFVNTELTQHVLGESGIREVEKSIPIGRLAHPTEIAELVAWLSSPMNTYVSGQNYVIDGGVVRV